LKDSFKIYKFQAVHNLIMPNNNNNKGAHFNVHTIITK